MLDADFARFASWVERTLGGKVVRAERQGERRSERAPIFALLGENLRDEHRPAAPDDYARYRLDLALRLATHLRNADAFGAALEVQELDEIAKLAGARPRTLAEGDAALERFIAADEGEADARLVAYLYRRAVREEALWRGALGAGERAVFQRLSHR